MAHVVLTVGHRPKSQGAVSASGDTEFTWCGALAQQVALLLELRGHDVTVLRRTDEGTNTAAWSRVVHAVNSAPDVALCVELHFNANANLNARGSCALYHPNKPQDAKPAVLLASACAQAIDTKYRGALAQALSWNKAPLLILRDVKCPVVLLETHFGSCAPEHAAATLALQNGSLAGAITRAIAQAVS